MDDGSLITAVLSLISFSILFINNSCIKKGDLLYFILNLSQPKWRLRRNLKTFWYESSRRRTIFIKWIISRGERGIKPHSLGLFPMTAPNFPKKASCGWVLRKRPWRRLLVPRWEREAPPPPHWYLEELVPAACLSNSPGGEWRICRCHTAPCTESPGLTGPARCYQIISFCLSSSSSCYWIFILPAELKTLWALLR